MGPSEVALLGISVLLKRQVVVLAVVDFVVVEVGLVDLALQKKLLCVVDQILLLQLDFLLLDDFPLLGLLGLLAKFLAQADLPAALLQQLPTLLGFLRLLLLLHLQLQLLRQPLLILQVYQVFLEELAEGAVGWLSAHVALRVLA